MPASTASTAQHSQLSKLLVGGSFAHSFVRLFVRSFVGSDIDGRQKAANNGALAVVARRTVGAVGVSACSCWRGGVSVCRCRSVSVGVGRCCIAASTVRRRWCGGGVVVVVVVLVVELVVVLVVVVAVAVVVVVVVVVVLPVALRLPCGDVVGCCCSIRSIDRSAVLNAAIIVAPQSISREITDAPTRE